MNYKKQKIIKSQEQSKRKTPFEFVHLWLKHPVIQNDLKLNYYKQAAHIRMAFCVFA